MEESPVSPDLRQRGQTHPLGRISGFVQLVANKTETQNSIFFLSLFREMMSQSSHSIGLPYVKSENEISLSVSVPGRKEKKREIKGPSQRTHQKRQQQSQQININSHCLRFAHISLLLPHPTLPPFHSFPLCAVISLSPITICSHLSHDNTCTFILFHSDHTHTHTHNTQHTYT